MTNLNIKQVREKFPQYGDLSDQDLADALHGKFYSDMPKADFYGKIGFVPTRAGFNPADVAETAMPVRPPGIPRTAPALPQMPAPEPNPMAALSALMAPQAPGAMPATPMQQPPGVPPASPPVPAAAPAVNPYRPRPLLTDLPPETGPAIPQVSPVGSGEEQLAAMMGGQSKPVSRNNIADPERTGLGRAMKRGALRTAASPYQWGADIAAQTLSNISGSKEQIVEREFLRATKLDTVPEGIDLSSPESAYQEMVRLGYPANWANNFYHSVTQNLSASESLDPSSADKARDDFVRYQMKAAGLLQKAADIPMSPGAERLKSALAADTTIGSTVRTMLNDPMGTAAFLGEVGAESAPQIASSLIVGAVTRSPIVGMATMGAGTMAQEYGSSVGEFLREATTTETQSSLFGDEDVAQNLYLERAKILDAALSRIKKDRQTFKVLADRAETITSAGNRLDSQANAKRLETDSEMQAHLQAEANRKGPISDALTAAARDLKENPRQSKRIVGEFLDAIQAADQPDGGQPTGDQGHQDGGRNAGGIRPETRQDVEPPATERTEAGQQTVIPGAERDQKRSDEARKADQKRELEARQQQSKKGTATPQDGAAEMRANIAAAREKWGKPDDRTPANANDLTDTPEAADLFRDLAAADGIEARGKVADAWVLARGKETGIEHLVVLDADGAPLSVTNGAKGNLDVARHIYRAAAEGAIGAPLTTTL